VEMFARLVDAVRQVAREGEAYSARVRRDEHPPTAVFSCSLDGDDYIVSILPFDSSRYEDDSRS
jgi:hypothetical protein